MEVIELTEPVNIDEAKNRSLTHNKDSESILKAKHNHDITSAEGETSLETNNSCYAKLNTSALDFGQLEDVNESAVPHFNKAGYVSTTTSSGKACEEYRNAVSNYSLMSPDESSDEEGFTTVLRQPSHRYKVTFEDDDEASNDYLVNKGTKTTCFDHENDYRYKTLNIVPGSRNLPIIRKGLFSEDYFFENVRNNYSKAVRNVLEKANEWSCPSDAMHIYRNLRQRNLKLENQAVSVTEDNHSHKVSDIAHLRYLLCPK